MNSELKKDLELFELDESSSISELKNAYRELCKVWHPDRFKDDSQLSEKASKKLADINLAYKRIDEYFSNRKFTSSTTNEETNEPKEETEYTSSNNINFFDGDSVIHRLFNLLFNLSVFGGGLLIVILTIILGSQQGFMSVSLATFGLDEFMGICCLILATFPILILVFYRIILYIFYGDRINLKFIKYWQDAFMPLILFILILILSYFVGKDQSPNDPDKLVLESMNKKMAWAYEAKSSRISDSDVDILLRWGKLGQEWNLASAPIVRDFLAEGVSAEEFLKTSDRQLPLMDKILSLMDKDSKKINDPNIKKKLALMVSHHRHGISIYKELHDSVVSNSEERQKKLFKDLQSWGEKKKSLFIRTVTRISKVIPGSVVNKTMLRMQNEVSSILEN